MNPPNKGPQFMDTSNSVLKQNDFGVYDIGGKDLFTNWETVRDSKKNWDPKRDPITVVAIRLKWWLSTFLHLNIFELTETNIDVKTTVCRSFSEGNHGILHIYLNV